MSTQPLEALSYREVLGTDDPVRASDEFIQFSKDCRYLASIIPRLREEHPDCYVVVFEEQVVGAGPVLEDVLTEVSQRGIPRRRVARRFIWKDPPRMIL